MEKWTTVLVVGAVLFAAGVLVSIEPRAEIYTIKGSVELAPPFLASFFIVLAGLGAWQLGLFLDRPVATVPIRNANEQSERLLRRLRFVAAVIVFIPIVLLTIDLMSSGKILDALQLEISQRLGVSGASMLIQILLAAYSLVMAILAIDLFMAPIQGLKAKNDALLQATIRFVDDAKRDTENFISALTDILEDRTFAEGDCAKAYEAVCEANARLSTLSLKLDVLALNQEDDAAMRQYINQTSKNAASIVEALRFLEYYSVNAKSGGKNLARRILNDQVDVAALAKEMFASLNGLFDAARYAKPVLAIAWSDRLNAAWPNFRDTVRLIYAPTKN